METNDEIIKEVGINYGYFELDSHLEGIKEDINIMLNKARADERQRCIEELNSIDGKTEYESLMFMEHILERIRKREEARAKLGGSKELPPREMMWEGINYYKEQAIAKLSEEVD